MAINKTKVVTGLVRLSYANVWEPKAPTEGATPKYSVSVIIPKSDTETVAKINAAIDSAIEEGIGKFGGKKPNKAAIKLPLRDGDIEREDDEAYANSYFVNANSINAPQIVDVRVQPILDRSEVYSGVYARVSLNFYAFNSNGNKGIACGLGNIQKVRDGEPLGGKTDASKEFESCPRTSFSATKGKNWGEGATFRPYLKRKENSMKTISIDIETYSSVDLAKVGVYRYVESEDFEILLFGYSVDGGETRVVDLACGEKIPADIIAALTDGNVKKYAFNAQFERICLSRFLGLETGTYLSPDSWYCTMVWAATLGLPLSLEKVSEVLGIEKKKLTCGKELIRYFCKPCESTAANGYRHRNYPRHSPEKWELFKEYNERDVEAEMNIQRIISVFPVSDSKWENYHLDQRINDLGIALDMDFVEHAIACDEANTSAAERKAKDITGIGNPNSPAQLKAWLVEQGQTVQSLSKSEVQRLLQDATGNVEEILKLRQELAKSSVKKYIAMRNVVCADSRARGLIQFYGANRTGRYSGRLIQVQNLPQNHIPDLAGARACIKANDYNAVEECYGNISNVLSELIRTAFVPAKGHRFIVSDFSAIEARVIAWYAGEDWRLDVFEKGGDIYCASASQMFGVPVEKNGVNGHLRQKGKIAELALGYGGSVGALKAMGAVAMGIKEDELKPLVTAWRNANPHITKFWWAVDAATRYVVKTKKPYSCYGLTFSYEKGILFIKLPSGRRLAYIRPRIGVNNFGSDAVTYEGLGATKKWERLESYGPKFVENIVQATARDILAEAMQRLYKLGYKITMHVHDEVVLEVPDNESSVEEIAEIMGAAPSWAEGLNLRADGYECAFYKKE